jgi:hypothetical protein
MKFKNIEGNKGNITSYEDIKLCRQKDFLGKE